MKTIIQATLRLILLTSALGALNACSTTGAGTNATVTDGNANPAGSEVQTGGLGDDSESSGSDEGLSNPNAMVPGAHQKYFFDFDKSDVHSSDLPSIKVQAKYLISHPSAKSLLEGYTDIKGSPEYNVALGERRANAVKKVLMLDGAAKEQIRTMSYGAQKADKSAETEDQYAKDRRVGDDL